MRGGRAPQRRTKASAAVTGALLVALVGGAPAFASPVEGATPARAGSGVDLRLDSRAAGRLVADAKEGDATAEEEKPKADGKSEKSDEIKLTVTKGAPGAKQASAGSDDTFKFVKDWPFWAIVGGVVIVGASIYMINRNSNQERNCSTLYNAGCFGAK